MCRTVHCRRHRDETAGHLIYPPLTHTHRRTHWRNRGQRSKLKLQAVFPNLRQREEGGDKAEGRRALAMQFCPRICQQTHMWAKIICLKQFVAVQHNKIQQVSHHGAHAHNYFFHYNDKRLRNFKAPEAFETCNVDLMTRCLRYCNTEDVLLDGHEGEL